MIAVLALFAGIVAGIVLQPTVPLVLQPYLPIAVVAALDAVFGGIRATWTGSSTTSSSSSRSSPTSWWRRSSCTWATSSASAASSRPARRGRPRRTDLRQRGGHPPPRVQGVSGMPDDEPRPDQSDRADQKPAGRSPWRLSAAGDHRPAGRSARVRARRAGPQQHRRHPAGERPPGRPGADPVRPQQPRTAPAIGHHELERTLGQLGAGAQGREAALAEARRRADELGILAGTIPAEGGAGHPDPAGRSADPIGHGAGGRGGAPRRRGRGDQIGGGSDPAVRVVASTYFEDGPTAGWSSTGEGSAARTASR